MDPRIRFSVGTRFRVQFRGFSVSLVGGFSTKPSLKNMTVKIGKIHLPPIFRDENDETPSCTGDGELGRVQP